MPGKARKDLHAIDQAENRDSAEQAFDRFVATYATRHDEAADCLAEDRAARLACHDFPAEPLQGLLALSPSEIGAKTSWPLRVFKLAKSAERHWRKLDGANRPGQLSDGVEFRNGEPTRDAGEKAAA